MKLAEAARKPIQTIPIAASAQPIAGTGSVWNTNSYHWEEKSVATWANDTLRSTISNFKHTMNDATLSITEITTLTGEANLSIRKGKKIISFEYNIEMKWKVDLADADGN